MGKIVAIPVKKKAVAKKAVAKKAVVSKKKQLTIMVSSTVYNSESDLNRMLGQF
ncbi:MAG: hypothetical protein R2847_12625 [Bacteroidia bacterium]